MSVHLPRSPFNSSACAAQAADALPVGISRDAIRRRQMPQVLVGQERWEAIWMTVADSLRLGLRMSASTFQVVQRSAVLEQIFSFHFTQGGAKPTWGHDGN